MRISDWSSDVCSSDLTPRHGSPRHRRVGALAFAVRPSERRPPRALAAGEHIEIWAVPIVLRAPEEFIGLAAMLGDRRNDDLPDVGAGASWRSDAAEPYEFGVLQSCKTQIGRASGRERVCPYG